MSDDFAKAVADALTFGTGAMLDGKHVPLHQLRGDDGPTTKAKPLRSSALGENNGRLMAEYDCYTLASNPHRKGTKAHSAFVAAFTKARAARDAAKKAG